MYLSKCNRTIVWKVFQFSVVFKNTTGKTSLSRRLDAATTLQFYPIENIFYRYIQNGKSILFTKYVR